MVSNFNTLMLHVSDMQRSVSFYKDVLGLPLEAESKSWSQFGLGGGLILGLHAGGGVSEGPGWTPGFSVPDISALKESLLAAGVRLRRDFHDIPGGVTLGLLDPDGNAIDLTQMGTSCARLGVTSA